MSRQVRSPACGSPDTSSTRSRSRTPLTATTARLLSSSSSWRPGSAANSRMVCPPCSIGTSMECSRLTGTPTAVGSAPSIASMTVAISPASAAGSTTSRVMVTVLSTMPKLGAWTIRRRRSCSSRSPVSSTWNGAGARPADRAEPASWTWPSVIAMTPARRCSGMSTSASRTAAISRVPSSAPDRPEPDTSTRSTITSVSRAKRSSRAAMAALVRSGRSPIAWLAVRSTATTTTSERGSRRSATIDGLASASTSSASARARHQPPRARRTSTKTATTAATAPSAAITGQGTSGPKARSIASGIIGRASRGWRGRGPGRPCSCRSARTSPG